MAVWIILAWVLLSVCMGLTLGAVSRAAKRNITY